MSDILETFDNISIDVAKRKYYNVNKVNAVLEELRAQAVSLVEENERLRAKLAEMQERDRVSEEALSGLQAIYRETLEKAHQRADDMISEAEQYSDKLNRDAKMKSEQAARQVEDCLNAIRAREEQNIEFLNARLRSIRAEFNQQDTAADGRARQFPTAEQPPKQYEPGTPKSAPKMSEIQDEVNDYIDQDEEYYGLRNRVGKIAEEIRALEDDN